MRAHFEHNPDWAANSLSLFGSGRFESVSKPYAFHTVMRSMLVPLRLAADARGLELISEFDPAIDETICKANRDDLLKRGLAYEKDDVDEEAIVLGDEVGAYMRCLAGADIVLDAPAADHYQPCQ